MREALKEWAGLLAECWRAGCLQKDLIAMAILGGAIIVFAGYAGALAEIDGL